jgi:hypothetical protein
MANVFVIQNQHGHYLSKQLEWVDGRDKRVLFRTVHRDEAINMVFEQSSKNIELRAHPLECETDDSAQPKVEAGPPIMSQHEDLLGDENPDADRGNSDEGEGEPLAVETDEKNTL